MYRRLAVLVLPLLLAYAPVGTALAGHGSISKSRSVPSGPRHAVSPRHHTLDPDGSSGTYHSQRLQAKSEWRQARHHGSTPVRTAAR